ncbi:MAG TPA: PAS domain S-box protein [Candidatus Nanoarchaeia archaeon]|nr:PAS domain S-box protein [Candidatus Nanoarchaeia archaeon]
MCEILDEKIENTKKISSAISELVSTMTSNKHSVFFLETLMDNIPIMVFFKDTNNRLIKVNKYFCDLAGTTKDKIEGKRSDDFAETEHEKELVKHYGENDLDVINSKKPKLNIIENFFNTNIQIRTHKFPIIQNDEVVGVFGISIELNTLNHIGVH